MEKQKKDSLQRTTDLGLHFPPRAQEATELDAFVIAWGMSLHEEDRRKRRIIAKKVGLGLSVMLLILGGVLSYDKAWQQFPTLSIQEQETPPVEEGRTALSQGGSSSFFPPDVRSSMAGGDPQATAETSSLDVREHEKSVVSSEELTTVLRASQLREEQHWGNVILASEFGMHISGKGAGDPQRTPAAMQQAVEVYVSELREAYAQERAANPFLLGSLVLDLTVESSGRISRIRFQSAKLHSKTFRAVVLSLARKWRFPPASGAVKLSVPLFFLPPEMDTVSIMAWEKYTAPGAQHKNSQVRRTLEEAEKITQQTHVPEQPVIDTQKLADIHPLGIYKVISSTPLRSQPWMNAQVLSYLQPRMQVTVVGMRGEYLEVQSVEGRPSRGYVHWEDVAFMYDRS